MWSSADGKDWTSTPLVPKVNITSGPIARGASGTLVAIPREYQGSYTRQKIYRSTDGITWTPVDPTKYKGGHPIYFMSVGYVDPAACL
jgi:hypothetical protein